MIRVLLVDDHKLVRTGIRLILDDVPDMQVVAEATTGEEALNLARELKPDVVLMDVNMPGIGGLEATRKLHQRDPGLKVIAVSVHASEPFPLRLLEAGAQGYLTKDCAAEEVVSAVRRVHAGERYLTASIAQQLALAKLDGSKHSPFDALSQREMQVMLMAVTGQTLQAISDSLHLSPKTVSTYRARLFEKLEVSNDVELTRLALRYGVLEETPLTTG
ncbi:MAG TPA: UvrY/SirA/GacA family response regulator transcription factor [Gammaproteobacteria bacterium]|nr:UvrY/SirA/GacA family response regulator transcription factor [Gammaproteobacteria bacterium]